MFGAEVSSNAADYFAAGLKGRWHEARKYDEHKCLNQFKNIVHVEDDALVDKDVPLRNAMNECLREDYIKDCERALKRWNSSLEEAGLEFRLKLPNQRFFRRQGLYADHNFDLDGELVDQATFDQLLLDNLPSDADRDYVKSLMKPVLEPGKIAHWIAPPKRGINKQDFSFEYVRTDG